MNLLQFLNESGDQLDVSIQAAGKFLTSEKKIADFLSASVQIEHKTDGVKLTIIKQSDNGNMNDYVFAYKGNVLYSNEYDYQPSTKVKSESIGASQFKAVFSHFKKLKRNKIPVGTELFVEFLMRKPTLSSNYNTKHKMVLIGHSKSSFSVKFGKLKTSPNGFNTDSRDAYAKELKIDVPQLLFDGVLGSAVQFESGIKNKILKKEFSAVKNTMNWGNYELLLDDLRLLFLGIESKYGGLEEGVVIKTNGRLLKWQQDYQLDQEARLQIKLKYRDSDVLEETKYWERVKSFATELVSTITVKARQLDELLSELSTEIKNSKLTFSHSKKTVAIIKDDIQLNAKTLIVKKMRGNNNALIIGKFRVLTKEGHFKLIKRASVLYDNVVVNLVTSKDTKHTKELREAMIRETFPNVEITHSINGNLVRIINKASVNINVVYAGSDRVQAYKKQLKNSVGVSVKEMARTDSDISASKVIENIKDKTSFFKNTPKAIHKLYDKIRGTYEI